MSKRPVVAVSGGFSPPTNDKILLLKMASKIGDVVVYLNSDAWCATRSSSKKAELSLNYRKRLLQNLPYVSSVVEIQEDPDGSVCTELETRKPDFFAKGYWSEVSDLPEMPVCHKNNIGIIWFVQNVPEFSPYDAATDLRIAMEAAKK